jgi:hypothetical protein
MAKKGNKSPRRYGAVTTIVTHKTFLINYSGIIFQIAGFNVIIFFRSPDKAEP